MMSLRKETRSYLYSQKGESESIRESSSSVYLIIQAPHQSGHEWMNTPKMSLNISPNRNDGHDNYDNEDDAGAITDDYNGR